MKYIFLDIDGVLCTDNELWINTSEFWLENKWAKELKVLYPFNYICVKSFNKILTEVEDIKIVLSSDWRKHWSLDELDRIFKMNGVIMSPIETTEIRTNYNGDWYEKLRMSNIEQYLRTNNLIDANWVIIDDLNIREFLPEEHKDKFFLTDGQYGIGEIGMAERIIEKLKSYESK